MFGSEISGCFCIFMGLVEDINNPSKVMRTQTKRIILKLLL